MNDPRNYNGTGPDPYSDEHPQGAFNRSMREKSAQAARLHHEQPLQTRIPAPEPAEDKPITGAITTELADAITEAVDRRQRQPTLRESMREKSRQLLAIHRATYGGVRQVNP